MYREGDPATCFYVLLEGTLALYRRRRRRRRRDRAAPSQRGVYAGAWQAYLGDRVPQAYTQTRCG